MTINDIENLLFLAREGMTSLTKRLRSADAKILWESISNAEKMVEETRKSMEDSNKSNDQKIENHL